MKINIKRSINMYYLYIRFDCFASPGAGRWKLWAASESRWRTGHALDRVTVGRVAKQWMGQGNGYPWQVGAFTMFKKAENSWFLALNHWILSFQSSFLVHFWFNLESWNGQSWVFLEVFGFLSTAVPPTVEEWSGTRTQRSVTCGSCRRGLEKFDSAGCPMVSRCATRPGVPLAVPQPRQSKALRTSTTTCDVAVVLSAPPKKSLAGRQAAQARVQHVSLWSVERKPQ